MAKKKKNPWQLTDEQYQEFQQAYIEAGTASSHIDRAREAQERAQGYIQTPQRIPQWSDRRIALQNYRDALRNYQVFEHLGGTVSQQEQQTMQQLQAEYDRSWQELQQQINANRQGFGGLGMQTAAGILPGGGQVDQSGLRKAFTPGRGLMDFDTMLPTASNQKAARDNQMRSLYQQGVTEAVEKQAHYGRQSEQLLQQQDRAAYWADVIRNLPVTGDARVQAGNQQWMQQAAQEMGITAYTDQADLLAQLERQQARAQRMQATPARLAEQGVGQERAFRGALYQMDNAEQSLDANYYLAMRDQARRDARTVDSFQDLLQTPKEVGNWIRYNNAYAEQLYRDERNEELLRLRADPNMGQIYQQAMEASRNTGAVASLRAQAHGQINETGEISDRTQAQIRAMAEAYGITVGQGDAALEAALAQMHQQQSHIVNTNLARLQAQGYDPKRLRQYIQQALNEERMDASTAEARQYAAEHPGAASVGSLLTNVLSGGAYIATAPQAVGNALAGITGNYENYTPIDANNPAFAQSQYVTQVRDEVTRQITENGGSDFLYGVGMSILDNVVQMAVGALTLGLPAAAGAAGQGTAAMLQAGIAAGSPVSLATMGLGAASQQLTQLTEAGVPSDQAYLLATLSGGIEIITEKIGIDNLVTTLGRRQASQMLRNILQQSVAEGAEEGLAEIGNLAADYLVRMEDSEILQMIEEGRRMGLTEEQANARVRQTISRQVVEAIAAGALSGAGFGGGAVLTHAAANTAENRGRQIRAEGTLPQLQQQARFYGIDTADLTDQSTDRQIGGIHRQVEQAARKAEQTLRQWAAEHKYSQKGTDALLHAYTEYTGTGAAGLDARSFSIAFDTAYMHGRSDAQYDTEGAYLKRAATDGLVEGLTPGAVRYAYTAGLESFRNAVGAKAQAARQAVAKTKKGLQAQRTAAEKQSEGILQVEKISDTEAVLRMPDGSRRNITDMDTRGTAAEIVSQAMEDGYSAVVVNQMLKHYDGKLQPEQYYEQYRAVMEAGADGESLAQAKKAATGLSAAVAKEAHDRGRLLGKAYDLADRIGNAGELALAEYGYAAPAEFEKFYRAGLEGKTFRQAEQELGKVSEQIREEMQAAVKAGLRDNKGGFVYGKQSDGKEQKRKADVDPGQRDARTSEVTENAGSRTAEEAGSSARQADGRSKKSQRRVSAKELGIEAGTSKETIIVITEDRMTDKQKDMVQQYAAEGIQLVLLEGFIEINTVHGTDFARGYQTGDKLFATVSDRDANWEQIARHEAKHRYFRQHPDALQQEWRQICQYQSEEDLRNWLAAYAEIYGDVSNSVDMDYLKEEALCDLAADITYPDSTPTGYEALEEVVARGLSNASSATQRYSIEPDFKAHADLWNREGRPDDWAFIVGTTSDVIQGLGATEQDIYMLGDKVNTIFKDHPEMTLEEIKKIPEILEDPVLILESRNVGPDGKPRKGHNARLVVYGDMVATNDLPIMGILDIRPLEKGLVIEGFQKVVNAYTKNTALKKRIKFFEESNVLYADKKRTARLLKSIGFQMPIELQQSGYIGSISYLKRHVNIKGTPFQKVFKYSIAGRKAEPNTETADQPAEQELKAAQKRIRQLEGINQHLREQMRITPDYTPDPRQISKAARTFMAEYGGSWSQKELEGKLKDLWKSAQLRGKGELPFDQLMEQTRILASELVQNYLDKDNPDAEILREIKRYVRSTRMYLSPELRGDLDHYGGYQTVRKANFGRIRLANSGTGVDQVYQELSEQWPYYFPDTIWNPADQLMQIIDVINDGTQILQHSPLVGMPDAMDYMTNKILWELGLVKAAPKTKADKILEEAGKRSNREQILQAAGAHEQEQMEQLEAYYRDQLQKIKADREDRIEKLKEQYRQKAREEHDWKAEQEIKRKLLYHAGKLKRMSRKVSPEQQKQITEIFGDINTMCQRMTGYTVVRDYVQGMSTDTIRPEGYQDQRAPRRMMSPEEASLFPDAAGNKIVDTEDLKKWYEDQKQNNPDFVPDKRIEEILANWDAKQINMMSVQEAQALLDVALNIENEIRTQKQLIDAQDKREIYQQVQQIVDDVNGTRGKYDRLLSRGFTGWITESTLSPVRMIQRLTGYRDNDPMYQATLALQQGEMKMLDYQRRAYELFKPYTDDKAFMDYLAGKGKKQQPITIGGMDENGNLIEVKITPDMRVALYLHSQNYQNLRHIQRGGLTVPNYESYVKGKTEAAYDQATRLRLTPSQVRQIASHMTERELAYARRLEKYFNVMSKTEINETSVKLKGYEIAKTNHYYPIETNKDFVVKEFDSLKFDGSLENMGFTKERIEGGNPIMLGNASTTLARSVRQHSMYTGLAIPLRNFNKLRGVSLVASDEAGAVKYQSNSLMDTIRRKWGKSGLDYIEKMVADLSGVKPQQERGMEVLNKLRSNYAGAVLELNPSTAMKQLIAYPSAASVLGWDAMAVGLNKWERVNVEEINRYTPILWHRMQGYIDSDLGDYVADKKHKPRGLNWNQAVDVAVVKRIWKAAEWKVARDNRQLVQDRDAWMKATAELFNQVMLQSQANYTTMQRGQILRTDNVFLRSIAMFKTEPFQSFNVLYDAFANEAAKRRQLQAARQEAEQTDDEAVQEQIRTLEQAHREAKQRIAQAVPAVLTSNLLEALITFAWAFFRGKEEDWKDEESGQITAASFFQRLGMRTLANLGGMVPFGAELAEAVSAVVMGDQYYGIENMETSLIADAMTNFVTLTNTVKGWIEKPEDGEEKDLEAYDVVLEVLDQSLKLGALLGLPTENVAKTLKGITRWVLIAVLGEAEGEYWYRRFTSQTTGSGHSKEDLDALYQLAADGTMEAYDRLYQSILRYKDEEAVQEGLTERIRAAVQAGRIDAETALVLLSLVSGDADPDELYWKVQGWQYMSQTGADSFSRYDLLYDAMYDAEGFDEAYEQLLAHGVTEEQAQSQIRSQIGDWYKGTSMDELTISEQQAVQMLQQYGGKSAEDAAAQVKEWKCLVETGIAYGEIKQAVLDGTLSESQAAQMMRQYGGKSAEDAAQAAAAYAFMRQHPELGDQYEPSFVNKVADKYAVYGAGIDAEVYAQFVAFAENTSADQDASGNWISGSRKAKIVAYIAAIPGLTPQQRDNLMLTDYSTYNLEDMPW